MSQIAPSSHGWIDPLEPRQLLSRPVAAGEAAGLEVDGYRLVVPTTVREGIEFGAKLVAEPGLSPVSFTVEWGDGNSQTSSASAGRTVLKHAFGDGGSYTLRAGVVDAAGSHVFSPVTISAREVGTQFVISAPDRLTPHAPFTILFSTSDPGNDVIRAFLVDWGDGQIESLKATQHDATHRYEQTGVYHVVILAEDNDGLWSSPAHVLSVNNKKPAPSFSAPEGFVPTRPLTFNGTPNDAGSMAGYDIAWDFGDGSGGGYVAATDPGAFTPAHTYAKAGTFNVQMRLRDPEGKVGRYASRVSVASFAVVDDTLYVVGTPGADTIQFLARFGRVELRYNGDSAGLFSVGRIEAFGLGGSDTITADSNIDAQVTFNGDEGDDFLSAGDGSILRGGPGRNTILRP